MVLRNPTGGRQYVASAGSNPNGQTFCLLISCQPLGFLIEGMVRYMVECSYVVHIFNILMCGALPPTLEANSNTTVYVLIID